MLHAALHRITCTSFTRVLESAVNATDADRDRNL